MQDCRFMQMTHIYIVFILGNTHMKKVLQQPRSFQLLSIINHNLGVNWNWKLVSFRGGKNAHHFHFHHFCYQFSAVILGVRNSLAFISTAFVVFLLKEITSASFEIHCLYTQSSEFMNRSICFGRADKRYRPNTSFALIQNELVTAEGKR